MKTPSIPLVRAEQKSRRLAIGAMAFAILFAARALPAETENPARPNILMISVDDMNDWVNCLRSYGGKVHTPNIDRLAARGRLFTNAHCPSPMCGPSRNAIFSGLRPSTTGLYDNAAPLHYNHPEIVSLPRHFRDNGYHVAGVGKTFHQNAGMNDPTAWDEYPNFDYRYEYAWLPPHAPVNGIDRSKHPLYRNLDWGPLEEGSRVMHDAATVDWSLEFLRLPHEKPFFLSTGIILPHLPWFAPKRFFDLYPLESIVVPPAPADDLDDIPRGVARRAPDLAILRELGKLPEVIQAYLACISYVDELVGRLIDGLEQSAYRDNTIVLFWSDHGYHWGEKEWLHKFTLWERSTRVPFIVAGPGVGQPGVASERPVSLLDLYPTLIELCSLPPKPELEGVSLRTLLEDPAAARREPAVMEFRPGDFAVRTEHWRYIRYKSGGEELYDHQADPNEWRNLAGDSQYAALKEELAAWIPKIVAEPARINARTHAYDALAREWKPKAPAPKPPVRPPARPKVTSPGKAANPVQLAPGVGSFRPRIESGAQPTDLRAFGRGAPVRLRDGRLLMIYGTDAARFSYSDSLWAAESIDQGRSWHNVREVERNPDPELKHGRPAALEAPDGTIWIFYYAWRRFDGTPQGSRSDVWAVKSSDGGRTFGDRRKIWEGYTGMLQGAIATRTGNLLVPLSHLAAPREFNAGCLVSTDGGETWRHSRPVALGDADRELRASTRLSGGALEPSVVELRDGRILMTIRTIVGSLYESKSENGGLTWAPATASAVDCGGTQYVKRLESGCLALVWNPAPEERGRHAWPNGFHRAAIALSADEGETWGEPLIFAKAPPGGRVVHSLLVETGPGQLLLTMPEHDFLIELSEAALASSPRAGVTGQRL